MLSWAWQNYSLPTPAFDRFGGQQSGFSLELFCSSLVRWLCSLPGLVFNPALLLVSVRTKELRSPCSLLLAFGSGCDLLYLLSFSVPLLLSASGLNFLPLCLCFPFQLLPNLGLFSSVWLVFCVGLDRLLSVLCPFRYSRLQHSHLYLLCFLCLTFGYSLYMLWLAADLSLFSFPNLPVLCSNGDMFIGLSTMLLRNGLLINGASLLCYLLVGLAMRRYQQQRVGQQAGTESGADGHRLFRSLAAIMCLVVGSYFAICLLRLLYAQVTSAFFLLHVSPTISALLTCAAATSNPLLLFAFSNDYRRSFRRQFRHWPIAGRLLGGHESANQASAVVFTVTAKAKTTIVTVSAQMCQPNHANAKKVTVAANKVHPVAPPPVTRCG